MTTVIKLSRVELVSRLVRIRFRVKNFIIQIYQLKGTEYGAYFGLGFKILAFKTAVMNVPRTW